MKSNDVYNYERHWIYSLQEQGSDKSHLLEYYFGEETKLRVLLLHLTFYLCLGNITK